MFRIPACTMDNPCGDYDQCQNMWCNSGEVFYDSSAGALANGGEAIALSSGSVTQGGCAAGGGPVYESVTGICPTCMKKGRQCSCRRRSSDYIHPHSVTNGKRRNTAWSEDSLHVDRGGVDGGVGAYPSLSDYAYPSSVAHGNCHNMAWSAGEKSYGDDIEKGAAVEMGALSFVEGQPQRGRRGRATLSLVEPSMLLPGVVETVVDAILPARARTPSPPPPPPPRAGGRIDQGTSGLILSDDFKGPQSFKDILFPALNCITLSNKVSNDRISYSPGFGTYASCGYTQPLFPTEVTLNSPYKEKLERYLRMPNNEELTLRCALGAPVSWQEFIGGGYNDTLAEGTEVKLVALDYDMCLNKGHLGDRVGGFHSAGEIFCAQHVEPRVGVAQQIRDLLIKDPSVIFSIVTYNPDPWTIVHFLNDLFPGGCDDAIRSHFFISCLPLRLSTTVGSTKEAPKDWGGKNLQIISIIEALKRKNRIVRHIDFYDDSGRNPYQLIKGPRPGRGHLLDGSNEVEHDVDGQLRLCDIVYDEDGRHRLASTLAALLEERCKRTRMVGSEVLQALLMPVTARACWVLPAINARVSGPKFSRGLLAGDAAPTIAAPVLVELSQQVCLQAQQLRAQQEQLLQKKRDQQAQQLRPQQQCLSNSSIGFGVAGALTVGVIVTAAVLLSNRGGGDSTSAATSTATTTILPFHPTSVTPIPTTTPPATTTVRNADGTTTTVITQNADGTITTTRTTSTGTVTTTTITPITTTASTTTGTSITPTTPSLTPTSATTTTVSTTTLKEITTKFKVTTEVACLPRDPFCRRDRLGRRVRKADLCAAFSSEPDNSGLVGQVRKVLGSNFARARDNYARDHHLARGRRTNEQFAEAWYLQWHDTLQAHCANL